MRKGLLNSILGFLAARRTGGTVRCGISVLRAAFKGDGLPRWTVSIRARNLVASAVVMEHVRPHASVEFASVGNDVNEHDQARILGDTHRLPQEVI